MSSPLTVGERILLHLSQFSKHQDDYDVPFDVSQDGIASALRISRAHAAIELKKLRESDDVDERLAHIRKGKNRRKVYFLSLRGEDKTRRIREFAEKEGIDVKPLLDIRRCNGEELWSSLEPGLRPLFARACIFRKPFRRDTLPETGIAFLPEDRSGHVEMPRGLSESIMQLIDEREKMDCHSFAADYWLKEGDYVERLHHLVMAGRILEAEMLIASRGKDLLNIEDDDLYFTCSMLPEPSERYSSKINRFMVELTLRTGHHEECFEIINSLRNGGESDALFASMMEGKLLIHLGDPKGALESLKEARAMVIGTDIALECEISRALVESGQYKEARELLEQLLPETAKSGDGRRLADIQYLLGMANLRLGETIDAIKYLSKGMGVEKDDDRTRWYSALSEAYLEMGMREKSEEYRSMIPRSTRWSSASACPGR
jgi:tetratricopeptide (TPR) repeat protein